MDYSRTRGCVKCGLINGEMVSCCQCSDAFHSRTCVGDGSRVVNKLFRCHACISGLNRPFAPSDVTCNEEYYSYLDLYSIETADGVDAEPSIGAILLRIEWMLTNEKVLDVARCVSKYFSVLRGNNHNTMFHPSKTLNFHRLIDSLRLIVGYEEFESIYNQLANQEFTIAVGLAPSLQYFARKCSGCGAFRYLRSFCFNCGTLFNAKADACKDLNIPVVSSNQVKRARVESSVTSNVTTNSSSLSSNELSLRLSKHEEAALRGVKRFVAVADKEYYYHHFGGDIFFLLRNLATNAAPGLLREFAKDSFKQMCNRWLEDPPDQLNHDKDPNFEGSVSSCQVIQCLVTQDHAVRKMYLEPPNTAAVNLLKRFSSANATAEEQRKKVERLERHEQIARVRNSTANSVAPSSRKPESHGASPSARPTSAASRKRVMYNLDDGTEEEFQLTQDEADMIAKDYLRMAKKESRLMSPINGASSSSGDGGGSFSSVKSEGRSKPMDILSSGLVSHAGSVASNSRSSEVIDLISDDDDSPPPPVTATPISKPASSNASAVAPPVVSASVTVRTPHLKQRVVVIPSPDVSRDTVASSVPAATRSPSPRPSPSVPIMDLTSFNKQPGVTSSVTETSPKEAAKGMVRLTPDDTISLQSLSDVEPEDVVKKETVARVPEATERPAIRKSQPPEKPKQSANTAKGATSLETKAKRKRRRPETDSDDSSDDDSFYSVKSGGSNESEDEEEEEEEEIGPRMTRSRLLNSTNSSSSNLNALPARGTLSTSEMIPVTRHREILESVPIMEQFNKTLEDIKNRIQIFISTRSIVELLNIDPNEKEVPMTPAWHCQHCGADNLRNGKSKNGSSSNLAAKDKNISSSSSSSNTLRDDGAATEEDIRYCNGENGQRCGLRIIPAIDYSNLTESLCWAYFLQCMNIDIDPKNTPNRKGDGVYVNSLSKIVKQFPLVRSYSSLAQMGVQFYKHQCYFVTHLIYVFSDYGQHTLRRQLFAEEFYFIVTQMSIAIHSLEDAEIVGEFVHCLQILQYTEEHDPELVPLFKEAREFLVQREEDLGQRGKFITSKDVRAQYHASYCGAIGLMDSVFTKDDVARWNPRRPSILSMLH